jgi:hypothetical protein
VPLDPVPARARVRFVVGSHRWARRFVPRKFVDHTSDAAAEHGFERVADIDADTSERDIVSFDVAPDDVIAFHFRTVHSAPGTAKLTLCTDAGGELRDLGDDARFATRPWLHSPTFEPISPGAVLDDERFPRRGGHAGTQH